MIPLPRGAAAWLWPLLGVVPVATGVARGGASGGAAAGGEAAAAGHTITAAEAAALADRLASLERHLGLDVAADAAATLHHDAYDRLLRRERRVALRADSMLRTVPVRHPAPGARLTSAYSAARFHPILRRVRPHWGVDLAAPRGTPVLATAAGRVAAVVRTPEYGLRVDLDHGNGFVTRYAHLDAARVRRGDRVSPAQPIASLGATGLATGPVLHYEIYYRGRSRDPFRFLPPEVAVE